MGNFYDYPLLLVQFPSHYPHLGLFLQYNPLCPKQKIKTVKQGQQLQSTLIFLRQKIPIGNITKFPEKIMLSLQIRVQEACNCIHGLNLLRIQSIHPRRAYLLSNLVKWKICIPITYQILKTHLATTENEPQLTELNNVSSST